MRNKIYFASDFHLGVAAAESSAQRERRIVRWLDLIKIDAEQIYLVGDIFDFWFEYRSVVPKGYIRLLGKLAELRDLGIEIFFFTGNHDMWMFDYFEKELDIPTYRQPIIRELYGKTFFIGHGDGLGPGDTGYKILKKIFNHPLNKWLFARLHPNFGVGLANYWSNRSRESQPADNYFLGADKEWLLAYANRKLTSIAADYFVFGHRHLPIDYPLKNGASRYINLGDWLHHYSYAVFDGKDMVVKFFETKGTVFSEEV